MSQDEVVVTRYQLSNTENALRQRFLSNQRTQDTQPAQQTRRPEKAEPDQGKLQTFVKEMEQTMKQQATGSLAAQLLHSQASIMQQQVDLLKDGQRQMTSMLAAIPKPDANDTKRVLAEVMAPLTHQIVEFKQLYEGQRQAAESMEQQLAQLKAAMETKKPTEALRRTIDTSLDKFASQQATAKAYAQQAHRMIDEVKEKASELPFSQNIEFMMDKLQLVQVNTEKIEKDLMERYQRIVQQQQRLATAPIDIKIGQYQGSMLRIANALGGPFDYEGSLEELEQIRARRTELMMDFKSTAPMYPKVIIKPVEEVVVVQPKIVKGKPVQMVPQPALSSRKSSRKPTNYSKIVTTPRNAPPAPVQVVKQPEQPKTRNILDKIDEPQPVKQPPKLPVKEVEVQVSEESKVPTQLKQDNRTDLIEVRGDSPTQLPPPPTKISKDEKPQPQPTKPGIKNRLSAEDLMSRDVEPTKTGKALRTDASRNQLLEERVVDAVTQAVLCSKLKTPMKTHLAISSAASKWLGDEHLDILIRDGIFVDNETIEKEGKKLLAQIIQHAIEEHSSEGIQEDEYQSDFEAEEDEEIEEEKLVPPQPPAKHRTPEKSTVQTPQPYREIEIQKQPALVRESSAQVEALVPAAKDEELKELLQPRMLGMMSAAAVKQYVSSLVESGHISRDSTAVPPRSAPLVTPELPQPERQPSGIEAFLQSGVGAEIQQIIREEGTRVTPQRVLEKFASRHFTPSTSDTAVQTAFESPPEPYARAPTPIQRDTVEDAKSYPFGRPFLDIKYAPGREYKTKPVEAEVFGRPYERPPSRRLDLQREQELLREEEVIQRLPVQIPMYKPTVIPSNVDILASLQISDYSSVISSVELESPKQFDIENPEFINGFMEFVRRGGNSEKSLSEGEINLLSSVSSGEVRPSFSMMPKIDDTFELSEGEVDPDV
mmetsp:Transcript_26074/g.46304  ORF Transcript_26074/g.46304 Transcript_26074/m.46304 type:complete len:938 (-) Transcript_26074:326-3139(-)